MTLRANGNGLPVQGDHDLLPWRTRLGAVCDVRHTPDAMNLQILIAFPADLTHIAQDSLAQMQASGEACFRLAIVCDSELPASKGDPTEVGHPGPAVVANAADLKGVHPAMWRWPLHFVLFPQRCARAAVLARQRAD